MRQRVSCEMNRPSPPHSGMCACGGKLGTTVTAGGVSNLDRCEMCTNGTFAADMSIDDEDLGLASGKMAT